MARHAVHGIEHPLEVVGTVMEVADLAWSAVEHYRHSVVGGKPSLNGKEIDSLKEENQRLQALLKENLDLLQQLSQSPTISKECPPDLYSRIASTVNSLHFLSQMEHQASALEPENNFPFSKASEADLNLLEVLVNGYEDHTSLWVWVTHEMVPSNTEEWSGIDGESYVVVNEDQVVDGVANFIARCVLSNPKAQKLSPEELQKTVAEALAGLSNWQKLDKLWHAGKTIYILATWGIALAGLYRHRAIVRAAAKGVGATGKAVLRAM